MTALVFHKTKKSYFDCSILWFTRLNKMLYELLLCTFLFYPSLQEIFNLSCNARLIKNQNFCQTITTNRSCNLICGRNCKLSRTEKHLFYIGIETKNTSKLTLLGKTHFSLEFGVNFNFPLENARQTITNGPRR